MKTYCVKQRKETECVGPCIYEYTKNKIFIFFCKCAECGIDKISIVNQMGTLFGSYEEADISDTMTYGYSNLCKVLMRIMTLKMRDSLKDIFKVLKKFM